jgi:peroxiredoxin family protein
MSGESAGAADVAAAQAGETQRRGTILLMSGELDKAMVAFELATGFQAMGMQMSMWFVLFGTNCIRKPRSRLSLEKWLGKMGAGPGRNPDTDLPVQRLMKGLIPDGASNLPLSQLDFAGLGPALFKRIMGHKGVASLEQLIEAARDLGVTFSICQVCVDSMAIAVPDDLVVHAEVRGVSEYYLEVIASQYNVTI